MRSTSLESLLCLKVVTVVTACRFWTLLLYKKPQAHIGYLTDFGSDAKPHYPVCPSNQLQLGKTWHVDRGPSEWPWWLWPFCPWAASGHRRRWISWGRWTGRMPGPRLSGAVLKGRKGWESGVKLGVKLVGKNFWWFLTSWHFLTKSV